MNQQIVYFSATWCEPCKTLGPIMQRVGLNYNVTKIDVDHNNDLITRFGIRSIPTVLILENNKEIRRFTGVKSENEIINWINNG
jgi:thioredoxin-like negative regulator of GroEL